MTDLTKEAEAIVDEMKAPSKFSFADAIKKTSYPTGMVSVFLNGSDAGRLLELTEEIVDQQHISDTFKAASQGGIVDAPEKEEADARIVELEAERDKLIESIQESRMTFHLRGVAPAQWRLIDKKWRKEIKAPSRNAYSNDAEGDELYNADVLDANILRNNKINYEMISAATIKIVDANGNEDNSAFTMAAVENAHEVLLESEFMKIKDKVDVLTFANNLFAGATERDADFLQQP